MVALSDIPCVGVLVSKISEATVEAGIRGLRYVLCYKGIINNLNSEIEKVKIQETQVIRKVAAARTDGKTIENHVIEWQKEVENIKTLCDELSRQTTSVSCITVVHFPNPVSRFRLGRKAAHQSINVAQLTVSGGELLDTEIAYLPAVESVPTSNTKYQSFASRQEAYGKLWEALVNEDDDSVLGIYGMPGVGKTSMMEAAWIDAMDKKIFDKGVRLNVGGEKFDVISLQDKLAVTLGCNLQSKDETRRASQLKKSLINGGKTLVILDDVWDVIHLNNLGIPFGDGTSKGCKILLTSRKKHVCMANNCKDPIEIRTLTDSEAWEMFRNTVGTPKIQSLQDPSLAMKVCKECGALPLLIDAVGSALKVLTEDSWNDALYQLENCKFEEIDGIDPKVYNCIRFSFEKLAEGEKVCLLLCSIYPEDADVSVKMMFELATGSELLDSGRTIGGLIDNLKSSSLLLQGKDVEAVKVHDIIRDVARSISEKDPKYAFLSIRCRSVFSDNDRYATTRLLHLDLVGSNCHFPDDLVFPKLHTLWIRSENQRQQLSNGFFNGFMNLKVLVLKGMVLSEQQSIHSLGKLRVLILDGCEISQTFQTSISRRLETLWIWYCKLPSLLDLPEMKILRKLEILHEEKIEFVANAMSNLSSLEELKIPRGFEIRNAVDGHIKTELVYSELSQLRCLRNLITPLDNSHYYVDKYSFPTLHEFFINVGIQPRPSPSSYRNVIKFYKGTVENGWMGTLNRAEEVELDEVSGLPNGLIDCDMIVAFSNLRMLKIHWCNDMEHIASWNGRNQQLACFINLTAVYINSCSRLKFVFSSSVAKCLPQLEQLEVSSCDAIEEIVRIHDSSEHGNVILLYFPRLRHLELRYLPRLVSFYTYQVVSPLLVMNDAYACSSFSQLEVLKVTSCDKLENVIQVTMLHQFENLKQLRICYCKSLRTVFEQFPDRNLDKTNNGTILFPAVEELNLLDLPEFKRIWGYDHRDNEEVNPHQRQSYFSPKVLFPNMVNIRIGNVTLGQEMELGGDVHLSSKLTALEVYHWDLINNQVELLPSQWQLQSQNLQTLFLRNCGWPGLSLFTGTLTFNRLTEIAAHSCGVSSLFTISVLTSFQQLKKLTVSSCPLMEKIVEEDANGTNKTTLISLSQLESVSLYDLPNLRSIGISTCYMPALYNVKVDRCGLISTLFTRSAFRNLQLLQELQVSGCPLLEEIVEKEDANGNNDKTPVSFLQLRSVSLWDLPNLQSIGISACYMPALLEVRVDRCGLISSLFTGSAFKNLQRLQELQVSCCPLLEEIVEDENEDETPRTSDNMISLLQMRKIELMRLPRLGAFSSSSTFTFNMPALDSVCLEECPHMDKFALLLITAPLVKIFTKSNHIKDVSDLNNYIRAELLDDNNTKDGASD